MARDLTALTIDQINNALDYLWESEDIEAALDRDLDDDAWRDAMCCQYCGKRECGVADPSPRKSEGDLQRELEEQIVDGTPFSVGELRRAFRMVARLDNWKMPIDAKVSCGMMPVLTYAIPFMTGSTPTFEELGGGWMRVRAAGYYASIGA